MIDVEIIDEGALAGPALSPEKATRLVLIGAASAGVHDGHLAIELVDSERISALNAAHRGKDGPTDVLSFPIDEAGLCEDAPRELGDVLICPAHTADLHEAVLHGVLHLVGLDHERDDGEMLALQAEILRWEELGL